MAENPEILALVGNPRPGSRTAKLAEALTARLAAGGATRGTVDLAETTERIGPPLGAGSKERYAEALQQLHAARLVVVATPVYKGSYTGLLKSFLDHVGGGALTGVVAVPVITVGSPPVHALAADVHLRPLLVELGASTPTAALVADDAALADLDATVGAWVERNSAFLQVAQPAR